MNCIASRKRISHILFPAAFYRHLFSSRFDLNLLLSSEVADGAYSPIAVLTQKTPKGERGNYRKGKET